MNAELIIFLVLALCVAVLSVMTVTTKSIIRAATYLLFVLFGTAGFYFLMGYTFLGSVQVMVYAGGIIVLYVFSILLTSGAKDDKLSTLTKGKVAASLFSSLVGLGVVLFILLTHQFKTAAGITDTPSENLITMTRLASSCCRPTKPATCCLLRPSPSCCSPASLAAWSSPVNAKTEQNSP